METHIKILTIICLVFTLAAFAFSAWCAYNCFVIGDITLSLVHTALAIVDLFFLIRTILLFTK